MKRKKLLLIVLTFLGLVSAQWATAQNVTIGPNNGSIITGQAGGNLDDSGIGRGMGSMWRHEQLPLTMTTSDIAMLTSAGELADPSCAIDKYNGKLIIGAGQTQTFVVVSLPKGYRITGYRLELQPNIYGDIQLHPGKNSWAIGTDDHMRFYETEAWGSVAPYTIPGATTGNESNTHCTLTNLDDYGYDYITVAHEIGNDNNLDMYNNTEENRAKTFVINREAKKNSNGEWDMGNQLHFFFARGASQYALTIKSFEITFSAEGTFTAELTPTTVGEATSVVQSPFSTSKMDVGSIVWDEAKQLYLYDYTAVQELAAYNWLYQKDAVAGGEPSDVAENKHIYPVMVDGKAVYAFGNDTYFVEPPTTIETASGWNSPIGFRIVGAKFDYQWGTDTQGGTQTVADACYIGGRYSNNNSQNVNADGYLNDHLDITGTPFAWQIDINGNIYKEYTNPAGDTYRKYLACFGSDEDERVLSLSTTATGAEAKWNLRVADDGRVYYKDSHDQYYYLNWRNRQEGSTYHSRCYLTKNGNTNLCSATTGQTHTVNLPSFSAGSYTLEMYGTDKTTPVETVTVNSASDVGSYTVKNLNNDAVMFKISDLPNGKQAIVKVTLMLEALNPYIDKMDIVCHDDEGNLELTQSFTSNDFSVSGGKFIFYVPDDYSDVPLTFTFSDLYSKYGDNTYYNDVDYLQMNGNARYSYVTSNYFKLYSGNSKSGVTGFPVNGGLYDNSYTPDTNYKTKVYTSTAGNIRFKFNNAENLVGGTGTLLEYPFTVSDYIGSADPDNSTETGTFIPCVLIADPSVHPDGKDYEKSDIFYVFTADETRYNIAPTTALQHRYYAFYRMDIELEARTFTPNFTYTPIYDKTFQLHKEPQRDNEGNIIKDGEGNIQYDEMEIEDSMWGLTLDVATNEGQPYEKGYLTYQEIIDNILGRETIYYTAEEATAYNQKHNITDPADPNYKTSSSVKKPAIASTLNPNNQGAPKYMRQILYVDGTPLYAMLNSSENAVVKTLKDLKDSLAVNSLVFLPENTTSTMNNVAYKMGSGAFRAGGDIVLTDKQPFYSPYDIQVASASKATYTREITLADNGQVTNATIMLPFTLELEDGLHTNHDGKCKFYVNTMETGAQMETQGSSTVNYGTAYFKPLTGSVTVANKPYMIKVESIDASVSEGNTISFIATQEGSSIVKTPDPTNSEVTVTLPGFSGKLIQGETAQAKYNTYDYYFTNYASYSGGKFDRADSENVFYFWKNKYVDLHTLWPDTQQYLMGYPFRGVYTYDTSATLAKLMYGFYISYNLDEMENAGSTTGLEGLGAKADMMIRSGRGFITITATTDQKFAIRAINGMTIKNVSVSGGNTTTISLPAGIYIVNNTKITVK